MSAYDPLPPVRIETRIGPLHVLLYAMSFCGGVAFCLLVMGLLG